MWFSTCLVRVRPWVQTPGERQTDREREKEKQRERERIRSKKWKHESENL
jgi:hypothetical protein